MSFRPIAIVVSLILPSMSSMAESANTPVNPLANTLVSTLIKQEKTQFNVSQMPLQAALLTFARQAEISFSRPKLSSKNPVRSKAVKGNYFLEQGLKKLLDGTGYHFEVITPSSVRIFKKKLLKPKQVTTLHEPALVKKIEYTPVIQEILITSTKRAEHLSQLPYGASVVSFAQDQQLGQLGTADILRKIPGLHNAFQRPGQEKIIIRGISDGLFSGRLQSLVTTYIDNDRQSYSTNTPGRHLLDINRIEVLRGPQGTLYGSGTLTGIYRQVSNKPLLDEVELKAQTTLASTKDGAPSYNFSAVANIPIVPEKLALRAGVLHALDGGYIDDIRLREENTNDTAETIAQASLLFTPWQRLKVTLKGKYQALDVDDSNYYFEDLGPYQRANFLKEPLKDTSYRTGLNIDLDLGWAALNSSSSYTWRRRTRAEDISSQAPRLIGQRITESPIITSERIKSFTQEIHLASKNSSNFEWIVGGFYARRTEDNKVYITTPSTNLENTDTLDTFVSDTTSGDVDTIFSGSLSELFDQRLTEFLNQIPRDYNRLGFDFNAPDSEIESIFNTAALFSLSDQRLREIALFSEATYHVTPKFSVTGGLRWFDYVDSRNNIRSEATLRILGSIEILSARFDRRRENGFVPKFVLSYTPNDASLIYTQVSQGYRLGGRDQIVPYADLRTADFLIISFQSAQAFQSDRLTNYELGLKHSFFDERLNVNLAGYYVDWNNIQSAQPGLGGRLEIRNIGDGEIFGLEAETIFKPNNRQTLQANVNWNNSRITNSDGAFGAVTGDPLPGVPAFSTNVSASQKFTISHYPAALNINYQYTGGAALLFRPDSTPRLEAHHVLSSDISVNLGAWQLSIFAENILNTRANVFGFSNPFNLEVSEDAFTSNQRTTLRPRTIGLSVSFDY